MFGQATWLVLAFVFLAAAPGHGGVKAQKLRAEVAALKAKLAQLEAQSSFLMRRGTSAGAPVRPGAGVGLCTDPCSVDSDGDGTGDCEDSCPCDPEQLDGDHDGSPDCADPCPTDATNACIDPCRTDSDHDGANDCQDPCPFDPAGSSDGDDDGVPDCVDPCPGDRKNGCFDPCPLDADGDGVKDCSDPCPWGQGEGRNAPCILPPPGPIPPPTPTPTPGACVTGGCSGQLCGSESQPSTCEWRPEYACYRGASCESQANGDCGWTMTDTLKACLANPSGDD